VESEQIQTSEQGAPSAKKQVICAEVKGVGKCVWVRGHKQAVKDGHVFMLKFLESKLRSISFAGKYRDKVLPRRGSNHLEYSLLICLRLLLFQFQIKIILLIIF
jgi:hypothetical protein